MQKINNQKAYEYFNCSEEILKFIFNNMDKKSKELMIKKWGKDLDNIGNTRELKKYDLKPYEELEEQVKLCMLMMVQKIKHGN